jgi:hypothetical protein
LGEPLKKYARVLEMDEAPQLGPIDLILVGECIRIRVQRDLRGEKKSIRPYGLRIRTDWLRGTVRYNYVFHGMVLLVDGAKE